MLSQEKELLLDEKVRRERRWTSAGATPTGNDGRPYRDLNIPRAVYVARSGELLLANSPKS